MKRCSWVSDDPAYIAYHDKEWGYPLYDDLQLFEMINLEGAQAGLSWITILKKRANYREAFDGFDPEKIVHYDEKKFEELRNNSGIVRNKLKIKAVQSNAVAYLKILESNSSFSDYLWKFVNGQPIVNYWSDFSEVPVTTQESDQMSKDLKHKGFKFIGSTICYAFMQAVGMVNDHTTDCFRHTQCIQNNS